MILETLDMSAACLSMSNAKLLAGKYKCKPFSGHSEADYAVHTPLTSFWAMLRMLIPAANFLRCNRMHHLELQKLLHTPQA